jgi:hypothetical protein
MVYIYPMKKDRKFTFKEKAIAYGLVAGITIGLITDTIGLWLSLGIVFGAGIGSSRTN